MIDIYATYTKYNAGKRIIQSIPAGNESNIRILTPIVKGEFGNAESMDFSVQNGTPFYDQFIQMRTFIQVDYDGETIFYGRVLTINNGFHGEQKIHCEGALAFLNDSYYPGQKKDARRKLTTLEYILDLLNNHNSQVNEPLKAIYAGEVPGAYSSQISEEQRIVNDTREFGQTSWANTKAALEDLKSHYGGAFRIRYAAGKCFLDWVNHYYRSTVNSQTIEVGKNLLDASSATEVSNIFTAIIPIGKTSTGDNQIYVTGWRSAHGYTFENNYIKVPEVCAFYSDSELNSGYHKADDYRYAITKYGTILKTVEFQDAHTQNDLVTQAVKWIKDNFQGGVLTFSVKAIDLHLLSSSTDKIVLGDRVHIKYPVGMNSSVAHIEDRLLTCIGIQMDLFDPKNNSYTFGIPANALGKTYGDNSKKKTKQSAYTPPKDDKEQETDDAFSLWIEEIRNWFRNHKIRKKSTNNQETGITQPDDQTQASDGSPLYGTFLQRINAMDENGSLWTMWKPKIKSMTQMQNFADITWDRHDNGTPKLAPQNQKGPTILESKAFYSLLNSWKMFDYVFMEYGIDLRGDLTSKMPSIVEDDDGNTSFWGSTQDGQRVKLVEFFKEGSEARMKIYGAAKGDSYIETKNGFMGFYQDTPDGRKVFVTIDPDSGSFMFLDDDGNPTTIRGLHLDTENNKNFIGQIVKSDYADVDGNIHVYKFGQEIETWAADGDAGEYLHAYVDGDIVHIGNRTHTQSIIMEAQEFIDAGLVEKTFIEVDLSQYPASVSPKDEGWYEIKDGKRVPTEDTRVRTGKKYFMKNPRAGQVTGQLLIHHINENETEAKLTADQIRINGRTFYEAGLVDEDGKLTAGFVIEKLNNNTSSAKLTADQIRINGKTFFEAGLIDENGELTAGFVINKINNNTTSAKLTADQVRIQGRTFVEAGLVDGNHYRKVDLSRYSDNVNPQQQGWYNINDKGEYFLTGDTEVIDSHEYFEINPREGMVTGELLIQHINDNETEAKLTADQIRINGRTFFQAGLVEDDYLEVTLYGGEDPAAEGLYEYDKVNKKYILTGDHSIYPGKHYYRKNPNGGMLTAGILVDKINDQNVTFIRGDRVVIGDTASEESVMSALMTSGAVTSSEIDTSAWPDDTDPQKEGWYYKKADGTFERTTDTHIVPGTKYFRAPHEGKSSQALVAKNVYTTGINSVNASISYIKNHYLESDWIQGKISQFSLVNVQAIASASGYPNAYCSLDSYYGNHYKFNVSGGGGVVTHKDLRYAIAYVTVTSSGPTSTIHLYSFMEGELTSKNTGYVPQDVWDNNKLTFKNYTGGWDAAYSKCSWPYTHSTSQTGITIYIPSDEVDKRISRTYYLGSVDNNHGGLFTMVYDDKGVGTEVQVAQWTHSKYNDGWEEARKKCSWPYTHNTSQTGITIYVPSDEVGKRISRTYYLGSVDNNHGGLFTMVYNEQGVGTEVQVAQWTHSKYNDGWEEARKKCSWPYTHNTSQTGITIYIPDKDVGKSTSRTYYLGSVDNNHGGLFTMVYDDKGVGTEVQVAQWTHSKFNDGWEEARKKCSWPYTQNTSQTGITIYIPDQSVGTQTSRTYYLGSVDNNHGGLFTMVYNAQGVGTEVQVAQWTHSKYNDGWEEARKKCSWPYTQNTSQTGITIYIPDQSVGNQTSRTYYLGSVDKNHCGLYTMVYNAQGVGTEVQVAQWTHSKYDDGWKAAYDEIILPASEDTSHDSITVQVPTKEVDGGHATRTYILNTNGKNDVKLETAIIRNNQTVYIPVANFTHRKYNEGWKAAYDKIYLPISEDTSHDSITVQVPPKEVDNPYVTRTYIMGNDGSNATKLTTAVVKNGQTTYVTVAKYNHYQYHYGWNAATKIFADGLKFHEDSDYFYIAYSDSSSTPGTYTSSSNAFKMFNESGYINLWLCDYSGQNKIAKACRFKIPETSHNPLVTTNAGWYIYSGATEDQARDAAAQAMGVDKSKLLPIDNGKFRNNSWIWFKVSCGTTNKYYYTKIT